VTTTLTTGPEKTDPAVFRTRAGLLAWLAVALVCSAQLIICYLTVSLRQQVDPIKNPVSDYAFYSRGRPWFVAAILLVLLGARAITAAMSHAGLPRKSATNLLFGLWAAGLLLIAVFQGNRAAADPTLHGEIHRLGGAVFLTCLPLACWTWAKTLATDPRWTSTATRIRRLSVAGAVTAAAFGLAQVIPALPQGLLERLALGVELVLLIALALVVRRAAR
jgi:hypothetical protein